MLYEATQLTRIFKNRTVLQLEHLAIEQQKIYTLIGPNGAGKTTLLNLLAFLDRPTTGRLTFRGQAVRYNRQQLLDLRRRIVLVDQHPILFTGPVWKNVEFGLKVRGISKTDRKKRVEHALKLVGMQAFQQADAHKLSGGETRRVALARALVIEPEVLLCDEPTANVDEENQEIILKTLERINREKQTSIVLATHYLSQSRRLAHHTLMLEHGTLAEKMKENMYRCRVTGQDGDTLLCQLNGLISLRLPSQLVPDIREPFRILIDPRRIRYILPPEEDRQGNKLTGQVIGIKQDTEGVRITIDCGIKIQVLPAMEEYRQNPPMIGQQITVGLPDTSIRFSTTDSFG